MIKYFDLETSFLTAAKGMGANIDP